MQRSTAYYHPHIEFARQLLTEVFFSQLQYYPPAELSGICYLIPFYLDTPAIDGGERSQK